MTHLSSEKYQIWQQSRQLLMMIYKITEVFSAANTICLCQRLQNKAVAMTAHLLKGLDALQNEQMLAYCHLSLQDILDLKGCVQKAFECHLIQHPDYLQLTHELRVIETGLKVLLGESGEG